MIFSLVGTFFSERNYLFSDVKELKRFFLQFVQKIAKNSIFLKTIEKLKVYKSIEKFIHECKELDSFFSFLVSIFFTILLSPGQ